MQERDSLSFSLLIDDRSQGNPAKSNIVGILPRRTCVWIDDESVDECYLCHTGFGWYIRRHHCRGCGRVFCYNCSKYTIEANDANSSGLIDPEKYLSTCLQKTPQNKSYRSCKECMIIFQKYRELARLIAIFELLPFEITEYYSLRCINRMWYEASNIYLSRFREIQYNLPNHMFSSFEKRVLKTNLHLLLGHSKLICQFIKSLDWEHLKMDDFNYYLGLIQSQEQTCKCWALMCCRECQKILHDSEVIDILLHVNAPRVREVIIGFLTKDLVLLESYVPILTYSIRLDEKTHKDNLGYYTIRDHLINLSVKSDSIRYKFFWEILVQLEEPQYNAVYRETLEILFNTLEDHVGVSALYNLKNSMKLINALSQLSFNINNTSALNGQMLVDRLIANDIHDKAIPIPLQPRLIIGGIDHKNVKVMNSATKPILIPCYVQHSSEVFAFIYKSEDIRKDNVISCIIKVMDHLLKSSGLDMNIVTYNVLPTAMNSGIIEIVSNSETLYNIKEKYGCSVQNYILEKNSKSSVEEVRTRFIKSTAAYCVMTYLLGIGDRHMDNIMVTDDGRLFHIDYSFVLGLDPKPLAPKMRITAEMIDALGGVTSAYYKQFEEHCSQCYHVLRRYANLFTNMLFLLTKIGNMKFTLNQLEIEIAKRFLPGEYLSQAKIQLIKTINNSKAASTLVDFIHYHYKENFNMDKWGSFDIYEKVTKLMSFVDYYNPLSRGTDRSRQGRKALPEPPSLANLPNATITQSEAIPVIRSPQPSIIQIALPVAQPVSK